MEDFNSIYEAIVQFGMWVVFLILFVREQRAHFETRKALDRRIQDIQDKHNEDIRLGAGLRPVSPPHEPGGD